MGIATYEATVKNGLIRLKNNIKLPENATVYVIVPDVRIEGSARLSSPRLLHPEEAADFEMEVAEESPDAGV